MHTKEIYRRTGLIAAVVVGVIIGMMVLPGTSSASRPATPMNIADPENPESLANVTEAGALQVAGQVSVAGTSEVQVTNFPGVQPVSGSVNVGNLPAVQEVNGTVHVETPIARTTLHESSPEFFPSWDQSFQPINARFISVSSDDEVTIYFSGESGRAIVLGKNRQPTQTVSLPLIVPLTHVAALCENESEDCFFSYTIIGE